jgi:hypothetical protein
MAEQKTKPTAVSVDSFLAKVPSEKMRQDSYKLIQIMKRVTGREPAMWGASIVGFGEYHYKYDSGHEGDICITGFSPRKTAISLYVLAGYPGQSELLKKLGKHKAAVGCLYVKKLDDVDLQVLEDLIRNCVSHLKKRFGEK